MEYRNLGKSGLKISSLSLGSWLTFGTKVNFSLAKEMMAYAYEMGINFFDNAEIYEKGVSEELMGQALDSLNFPRDSYCVSSKAFWGGDSPTQRGLSRKHLTEACHRSIKRLRVDYLDLFFCHRPDQTTPIEETVWAMHNLILQGKILYWGTSEWSSHEIVMAHKAAKENNLIPPTMEQPQYNMFVREKMEHDYIRIFKDIGLGTTIWSPLASGLLTGKYNKGIPKDSRATLKGHKSLEERFYTEETKNNIKKIVLLEKISKNLGCSMAQLALAWCLKNPNVSTVILGASKISQLEENIKTIDIYSKLDTNIMNDIEKILNNKPEEIRKY